jgi:hypothetical protein
MKHNRFIYGYGIGALHALLWAGIGWLGFSYFSKYYPDIFGPFSLLYLLIIIGAMFTSRFLLTKLLEKLI